MPTDSNKADGQDTGDKDFPSCADEIATDPVIGHDLEGQIATEKPRSQMWTYIACAVTIPILVYTCYRLYQFDQYIKAKTQPTYMKSP